MVNGLYLKESCYEKGGEVVKQHWPRPEVPCRQEGVSPVGTHNTEHRPQDKQVFKSFPQGH